MYSVLTGKGSDVPGVFVVDSWFYFLSLELEVLVGQTLDTPRDFFHFELYPRKVFLLQPLKMNYCVPGYYEPI